MDDELCLHGHYGPKLMFPSHKAPVDHTQYATLDMDAIVSINCSPHGGTYEKNGTSCCLCECSKPTSI
jgi:hypothetical protein